MSADIEYEAHLTLATSELGVLTSVSEWAESHQLKWTHIVLDGGDTPSQPMMTFWGKGDIVAQLARTQILSDQVGRLGALVVRVKIETRADSRCQCFTGVANKGYFENHVKLILPSDVAMNDLQQLALSHGARLSRNARRVRTDGRQERFVTQRVYDADHATSRMQFERLMVDLQHANHEIVEIEREFVVFDSHLALDSGWL